MISRLHGLYAITDSTLMSDTSTLLQSVEAALLGGASIIQYRDKSTDSEKRLTQARLLTDLCQRYARPLVINDDVALAEAVGVGVHLGQKDGDPEAARKRLGNTCIIGVTCHDRLDLALKAQQQGADYVAFGAFFPSTTKPDATPAPLTLLQEAKQQLSLPVVAIGGLSVDNAPKVISAGADMVAVIHQLFSASDITHQAQRFTALF
ncbi:thiamine phosphate synthase [Nitrincola alkalilacustris]|uniref:thiamine phosphate synthase n=1 Tax=Nitrincola alkalilacustris TaxID=1571224 RepID=UPI00124BDE0F|nr:thiamine phosphate synthase [Nitrincola alkalilacustris]